MPPRQAPPTSAEMIASAKAFRSNESGRVQAAELVIPSHSTRRSKETPATLPWDLGGVTFKLGFFPEIRRARGVYLGRARASVSFPAMLVVTDIIDRVRAYQPAADGDLIKRAYDYSSKMHDGQTRKS